MLDDNNSAYIDQFLPKSKDLVNAMNEHVRHQHKLSPEKERLEGTVMPFNPIEKENHDLIKRR
ncbi:MAG: hypothetical protein PHH73_06365 [Candidatus Rickettsiella isopodorum]|nr:hypothetical protein [Candidatus Rickettsiella isopodorum]